MTERLDDYEKKKIIECLAKLRTPRDEMYQTEIRRLEDKYALLALEHDAAIKSIESFESIRLKLDNYCEIDIKELITEELENIRNLKDRYETHVVTRHNSTISELKKLAIEYKEMTMWFKRLDGLLGMTFEVGEGINDVFSVVEESMKDFKFCVKKLLSGGNSRDNSKIMQKIVSEGS